MAAYSFVPYKTQLIALTTVGSAAAGPSTGSGLQAIEVSNLSTNVVFGTFSTTGVVATLPTTAAAQPGFCLGANAANVRYVVPPNTYVSALTTGVGLTAILALTQGQFM